MNNNRSNTSESFTSESLPVQRGGLVLFGYYIDPIEIMLHLLVLTVLGIPAIRASVKDGYAPKDGLAWIGVIIGASTFVRLSPTDRVDAYLKLKGLPSNHDQSV